MATPTSNTWQMADRLADGKLEETITDLRGTLSPERIAQELRVQFGAVVTRQTITNWLALLDEPDPEPADAA